MQLNVSTIFSVVNYSYNSEDIGYSLQYVDAHFSLHATPVPNIINATPVSNIKPDSSSKYHLMIT